MILAAGLGTRMRGAAPREGVTAAQRAVAARGIKGLIPFGGRPFLDFVLSSLADAGCRKACLVIGPTHQELREHYTGPGRPSRLVLDFCVQAEPLGTAHALLAAESCAAGTTTLLVNSDNLYPREALAALCALPRAGLLGFRRSGLIRHGNIPPERIRAYALIEANGQGDLVRIVEKPDPAAAAEFGDDPLVSMNAWLLPPDIFTACRAIGPSPRGELELQDAVRYAMDSLGERFRVIESGDGVLDLSTPDDIPGMTERLHGVEAHP